MWGDLGRCVPAPQVGAPSIRRDVEHDDALQHAHVHVHVHVHHVVLCHTCMRVCSIHACVHIHTHTHTHTHACVPAYPGAAAAARRQPRRKKSGHQKKKWRWRSRAPSASKTTRSSSELKAPPRKKKTQGVRKETARWSSELKAPPRKKKKHQGVRKETARWSSEFEGAALEELPGAVPRVAQLVAQLRREEVRRHLPPRVPVEGHLCVGPPIINEPYELVLS